MRRNIGQVMYMPRGGKVNEMPNPKTAEEMFTERIAALEAELAALKEKYRWRKMPEEMPSENEDILLYGKTLGGNDYFCIGFLKTYGEKYEFYTFDRAEEIFVKITHWRPLDAPEKDKADKEFPAALKFLNSSVK